MAAPTPQRVDIQGFRALAVLLVLADHLGVGFLAGGYIGVDVFFVLSGFLISSLLFAEVRSTGRVDLAAFYARRARRLLPAATLVLVVTLGFVAATASMVRVRAVVDDSLWAAFFLANVNFARQGQDYFAETLGASPVQHFWSLAVEEQFYLVWPALLLGLAVWWRRRRSPVRSRRLLVLLVAGICAVSLAWSVLRTAQDPQAAYFSTAGRAWELAAGALVALLAPLLVQLGTGARVLLSSTGLAAVAAAALLYDGSTAFPGWAALVPVLGTAALLAAGTGAQHPWPGRLLTVRPGPWIGDISYSLYLWHWPVILLGKERFPEVTAGRSGTLLLVAVSVLLAALSHRFVEEPFRRGRVPALSRGRGALALWPAVVGCVVAGAVAAPAYTQHRSDLAEQERQAFYAGRSLVDVDRLASADRVGRALKRQMALVDEDAPLPPELVNGSRLGGDLWQFEYTCNADWAETSVRICPVGDRDSERTVVLYGDSHAGVWLPALDRIGERHGLRIVPLVKFGCAPFDVAQLQHGEPFPECDRFRKWAEHRIAALEPDLVISSYRSMLSMVDVPGEPAEETWHKGVASALPRLAELAPLVLLSDYSYADFNPRDCLSDPGSRMRDCTFARQQDTLTGNRVVRRLAAQHQVPFVDVTRLVCAERRCPTVVGDVVTYRDGAHLTISWVRRVTGALEELVSPWLPGGGS